MFCLASRCGGDCGGWGAAQSGAGSGRSSGRAAGAAFPAARSRRPALAESPESVVLTDLELKLGIGRIAGKSPIAEGRCDLRESAIWWLLAIWG